MISAKQGDGVRWYFIAFIPLIGVIVLLVFMIMKGTEGENRFGPDPLASEE